MQEERLSFVKEITYAVAKMIAMTSNISLREAKKAFTESRTYDFSAYSDDPFVEDGPEDFFEMYQNEKKYGRMITDTQLYLEQHPELYKK